MVGSTHLKNISRFGSFLQVGVNIKKNVWNRHLDNTNIVILQQERSQLRSSNLFTNCLQSWISKPQVGFILESQVDLEIDRRFRGLVFGPQVFLTLSCCVYRLFFGTQILISWRGVPGYCPPTWAMLETFRATHAPQIPHHMLSGSSFTTTPRKNKLDQGTVYPWHSLMAPASTSDSETHFPRPILWRS